MPSEKVSQCGDLSHCAAPGTGPPSLLQGLATSSCRQAHSLSREGPGPWDRGNVCKAQGLKAPARLGTP